MLSRRAALGSAGLMSVGVILAGCQDQTSTTSTLSAQILADTTGALQQLLTLLPTLTTTVPPVLSTTLETSLLANVNTALLYVSSISATTVVSTGATVLARAEGLFNAVVGVLAMIPLPPPYNLVFVAVSVISASLEAYINSVITPPAGTPAPAMARLARTGHPMTIERARHILGIATLKDSTQ
jgi:hypothetical protein